MSAVQYSGGAVMLWACLFSKGAGGGGTLVIQTL